MIYKPLTPTEFGANLSRFTGEDAGKVVTELYAATDNLPEDGAVIDLKSVLSVLPVKLTTVSQWIEEQNWNR